MPKPFTPKVITANALLEGDVIYLADNGWTRQLAQAEVLTDVAHADLRMIEAAAQMCSIYHRHRTGEPHFLGFTRLDATSFRGQVVPGDTLHLLVSEVKFSPRRFICDTQGWVGDDIKFEARITGMVL